MTLNYTFEEQSGPAQYSEYTDEEFYDTEDFDWDYEITEFEIAKCFVNSYGKKDASIEENAVLVAEEIMEPDDKELLLREAEVTTLKDVVSQIKKSLENYNERVKAKGEDYKVKKITSELILSEMMDLEHYADEHEDELKDYFYEDAHKDFYENYD